MTNAGIFQQVIEEIEEDEIILESHIDEAGIFAVFAVEVDPTLDVEHTMWDFLITIHVDPSETWPDRTFRQLGRLLKTESNGLWTVDQGEIIPVGARNQFLQQHIQLDLGLADAMPMPKGFTKRIANLLRKALPATAV